MKCIVMIAFVGLTMLSLIDPSWARRARNVEELSRCVRMAEPLVHNPEYVFPLTNVEIHSVCRMWAAFVDCVQTYTTHFLTPEQLEAFGAAIEPSMQSIHQLCAEDMEYRTAYLEYAPCMKKTYISGSLCGQHYQYLADLVQGSAAPHSLLCCAHHKFRECVLTTTPLECGSTVTTSGVSAQEFVTSMMDRALGFLLQQCTNYRPTSESCPGYDYSTSGNYITDGHNSWPSTTLQYNSTTETGPTSTNQPPNDPRFKTHSSFNRNFNGGNSIAGPKTGQFRGITGGVATVNSPAIAALLLVVTALMTSLAA